MRNTLRRGEKKLEAAGDVSLSLYDGSSHTVEELRDAISEYARIYDLSWKSEEAYPQFMPKLIELCASTGELSLGILRLDGKPIAAQVWLISAQTAYIYKLAHDPDYQRYSAGTLLTYRLLKHHYGKVAKVDYGIGDEVYKRDWMTQEAAYVRLWIANKGTLRGRLHALGWRLTNALRRR